MDDGFEPDGTVVGGAAAEGQGFASMGVALAPPVPGTPCVPLAVLAGNVGRVSAPSVRGGAPGTIASPTPTPPPPLVSLLARIVPEGGRGCS